MKATEQVLAEMRAAADVMSPRSGIRSALEKWLPRLTEAVEHDVRATESVPEPRSPSTQPRSTLTGVFDVHDAEERQVWYNGKVSMVQSRRLVEKWSHKPFGSYPEVPR